MLRIPGYEPCKGQLESWQKAYDIWAERYEAAAEAIEEFNFVTSKAVEALRTSDPVDVAIGAELVIDAWDAYHEAVDAVADADALVGGAEGLKGELIDCYSDYRVPMLEVELGVAEPIEEPPHEGKIPDQ